MNLDKQNTATTIILINKNLNKPMDTNEIQKTQNQLLKEEKQDLDKEIFIGIKGIEPEDVLPPTLKLVQGTSDVERMKTTTGKIPEAGSFYYYGKRQTFDEINAYIINLTKVDDFYNKTDEGKPYKMYRLIGIFEDLDNHFVINFRKTAIQSVKNLIAAVFNQMKPLYKFKVKLEIERKKGQKGAYFIPVIKLLGEEANQKIIAKLRREALKYDTLNALMENKTPIEKIDTEEPNGELEAPEIETEQMNENIEPEDIPF